VKYLISNKQFWRWFSLAAYAGLLFLMGAEKVHRSHPAVFFASLAVLTLALMLVFKFLHRPEKRI
jgi:hypothetical protein